MEQKPKIEVEVWSNYPNSPVLRLPNRHYPGLLIQGDTVHSWYQLVLQALQDLQRKQIYVSATDILEELQELLSEYHSVYEDTLRMKGVELPYPSSDGNS